MVWYFVGVYIINRTLHGRLEIRNFSSRVEKYFTREIFFNTGREISYHRAAMLYLLFISCSETDLRWLARADLVGIYPRDNYRACVIAYLVVSKVKISVLRPYLKAQWCYHGNANLDISVGN